MSSLGKNTFRSAAVGLAMLQGGCAEIIEKEGVRVASDIARAPEIDLARDVVDGVFGVSHKSGSISTVTCKAGVKTVEVEAKGHAYRAMRGKDGKLELCHVSTAKHHTAEAALK